MPFVTKCGGLTIAHDVITDKYDEKGNLVREGNGLRPLQVAFGASCDYLPQSARFRKIVRRGQPDPVSKHWVNGVNPVWRVPTEDFTHQELLRILDFFKVNKNQPQKHLFYEPDFEDIEIKRIGASSGMHMPIWLIDELILMGEFDMALKESLIDDPHTKKIDQPTLEALMQVLEVRREEEVGMEKSEEQEFVEFEVKKRKGNVARAAGRQRARNEKQAAQEEAAFEARTEKNAKKVKEKLEDGVVS